MDSDTQKELYFLIAKFLRSKFPDVGEAFIKECEKKKLFPSCVFSTNPSFAELDTHSLSGIPNDQLMRLVAMALPKSQYPSLFYTPPSTNRNISITDILTKQIGAPLPLFVGMSPMKRIIGHFKPIFCMAVDLTGSILITGADDSIIKIWKIPSMSLISTIHAHCGFISEIAIHPSNRFFVSSSLDGTYSFVSLITNQIIQTERCSSSVNAVRFSPDGKFLAVATEDGIIDVFTVNEELCFTSSFVMRIVVPDGKCANWVSFSPGSNFLSFVTGNKSVVIVCPTSERYQRLDGHTEMADLVTFSRQSCGKLMSHSPKDRSIRIWEEKGGVFQETEDLSPRTAQNARAKAVRALWNCDETKLVAISTTQIYVWPANDSIYHVETCTYGTERCTVLALHPTIPDIAFVGCDNGHATIWDLNNIEAICKMQVNDSPHFSEAMWSTDGNYIFAADVSGGVTIFGKPHGPYTTTQEFFFNDWNPNAFGLVEIGPNILNSGHVPLNPQPRRFTLADLQLFVKTKEVDPTIVAEEEDLMGIWNATNVRKLEPIIGSNIRRAFKYDEIEDQEAAMRKEILKELEEAEPELARNDSFVPDVEEDGDFIEAQHNDEEEEEESSSETTMESMELPKTRSAGPVPEDEPMQLRPRTHHNTDEMDSDMLDAFDQEHEDSAEFFEEEIRPKPKPKPKARPKPRRTRRTRSNSYIEDDDEELMMNSDEFVDSTEDEFSEGYYDREIQDNRSLPIYQQEQIPEVNTPIPIWMYNEKRYQHTFVPQFGEKVVYIKSGHQKAAEECDTKEYAPPFTTIKQMPEISIGYVNTIECTPNYLLTYITFDLKRGYRSGVVAFPINESQPFLIPFSLYERSIENLRILKEGDIVEVAFSEDDKISYYKASIVDISPDFERYPYESVAVCLIDSNDSYRLCPWELMLPDPEQTPIGKMSEAMIASVQALAGMEEYAPFVNIREQWQKEAIWKHLSFPMDLNLFIARLKNGWYQTLNEMNVEILLFGQNAPYVGQSPEIAAELTEKIKNMIELKAKFAQVDEVEIPTE